MLLEDAVPSESTSIDLRILSTDRISPIFYPAMGFLPTVDGAFEDRQLLLLRGTVAGGGHRI